MKIKICGMTNISDCLAACEAGADFLGFNFYPPSPRYIEPGHCRNIIQSVKNYHPGVSCVGIFVNHPIVQIAEILDYCGLDLAQLSGDETKNDLFTLRTSAYKAIRPRNRSELSKFVSKSYIPRQPPAFLLDSYHTNKYGGTGLTGNWELAAMLSMEYCIFLAGGLNPENVIQAVSQVRPWGVDVASGVEAMPGVKDPQKIRDFIAKSKKADKLIKKNSQ